MSFHKWSFWKQFFYRFDHFLIKNLISATSQCAYKQSYCPKGNTGPGGCYFTAFGRCLDGLMCQKPKVICIKGTNGPGGCFDKVKSVCYKGKICTGTKVCWSTLSLMSPVLIDFLFHFNWLWFEIKKILQFHFPS